MFYSIFITYIVYIVFGVLPSIIWLLFYLRQDVHPEPKRLVLKIFFWGMLAAFPAVLLELGANDLIFKFDLPILITKIVYWFLGVAFIEEFLKYLVVRDKVLKNPEFDEPVDAMLYMIIAALGFAASENILIFLSQKLFLPIGTTLTLFAFRFLSATFLHALGSALIGYFLALSFFGPVEQLRHPDEVGIISRSEPKLSYGVKKKGRGIIYFGLGISTLLHGLYNFSIMEVEGSLKIIIPLVILIGLAIAVSLGFKKLKKITP